MNEIEPSTDFPYNEIDGAPPQDEAAEAFRQAARAAMDFYRRVFMSIQDYRGDKAMAMDCAMLALGWCDLAKAHTQEEVARRHKCERATINRLVIKMQNMVGVPPLPGQRGAASRQKFSNVRKQQLKTT
jgi:hypothetical protein